MRRQDLFALVGVALLVAGQFAAPAAAQSQEPPKIKDPGSRGAADHDAGGRYVRAAYNNEAYAILGYRATNLSVGEEWMLLDVGVALREKTPDYTLKRDAVSLATPDGKTLPLPDDSGIPAGERAGATGACARPARLDQRLPAERPPGVPIRFLRTSTAREAWDEVEMTNRRACVGRFYFQCRAASPTVSTGST